MKTAETTQLLEVITQKKKEIIAIVFEILNDYHLSEDIYQETYIKCKAAVDKGAYNNKYPYAFAVRVAKNLAIDVTRKTKRTRIEYTDSDIEIFTQDNRQNQIIKFDINQEILHLIDSLNNEQKEIVVLRLYYQKSYKEIAKITNISINTALGRMRYALINIRKQVNLNDLKN